MNGYQYLISSGIGLMIKLDDELTRAGAASGG